MSMGTTRVAGAYAVQTGARELAGQTLCHRVQCGVDGSYGKSPQVPPSDRYWDTGLDGEFPFKDQLLTCCQILNTTALGVKDRNHLESVILIMSQRFRGSEPAVWKNVRQHVPSAPPLCRSQGSIAKQFYFLNIKQDYHTKTGTLQN